jgi:transcriptional regulator with XRE-family HTH domain
MEMLKFPEEQIRFSRNLKVVREKLGKSQKNICDITHMEQSDLSNMENGKKTISLNVILGCASAFKMPVSTLFAICMSSTEVVRDIQLNSYLFPEKGNTIHATADGFPKKELVNEPVGEVFWLKKTYSQLTEDEFPEIEMNLQHVRAGFP